MTERINPANIKDNTEKTWFLGTDLFETSPVDLDLMEQGLGAMMDCDEAAMYATSHIKEDENFYARLGYSVYFQEIIKEAIKREYAWVIFDRDIESV